MMSLGSLAAVLAMTGGARDEATRDGCLPNVVEKVHVASSTRLWDFVRGDALDVYVIYPGRLGWLVRASNFFPPGFSEVR